MSEPKEPTSEQCSSRAQVGEGEWACWYPQMGGYSGKAVVRRMETAGGPSCYDVFVWHDGEFPFNNHGEPPYLIHHCDGEQFVEFGTFLQRLDAS